MGGACKILSSVKCAREGCQILLFAPSEREKAHGRVAAPPRRRTLEVGGDLCRVARSRARHRRTAASECCWLRLRAPRAGRISGRRRLCRRDSGRRGARGGSARGSRPEARAPGRGAREAAAEHVRSGASIACERPGLGRRRRRRPRSAWPQLLCRRPERCGSSNGGGAALPRVTPAVPPLQLRRLAARKPGPAVAASNAQPRPPACGARRTSSSFSSRRRRWCG